MSHNERYKSSIVGLYFRVRHPGITQSRYKIPLVRIDPRFVTWRTVADIVSWVKIDGFIDALAVFVRESRNRIDNI